jgi:GNAT superfamily N-acetyltransferase
VTETAKSGLIGPRSLRGGEIPELLELLNQHFRIVKGAQPTIQRDFGFIYSEANADNVMVMTDGGRIVASTGIWINDVQVGAVKLRVGGINCVLTLPEYRKRGLGMQVMEACHERMREQGCHVGLLGTRIVNWYRRLGWEYAGISRVYELNRGNVDLLPELPEGVTGAAAGLESIDEVVAIRQEHPLGGVRSRETFAALLTARNLSEFYLARQDGKAIAYLLPSARYIGEWAGPPVVLAGLFRSWYESVDDRATSTSQRRDERVPLSLEHASLAAPAGPLAYLLDSLRLPCASNYIGMLRLLDVPGILRAFGRDDIRSQMHGDSITISRGRHSLTLPLGRAAKLLFGPENVGENELALRPLPFCQWGLEHV